MVYSAPIRGWRAPVFNNTSGCRLFRFSGRGLMVQLPYAIGRPGLEIAVSGAGNAGKLRHHARQTRPNHGRRQ